MSSRLAELRRNPNWDPLEVDESPWRSRNVHLGRSGFWTDSDDGTGTFCTLLPIYDPRDFEVYDCVAWEPHQPRRWWMQTGIATVLGEADIRNAAWEQDPAIKLLDCPAEWLLAEPPCACVLDWRADLRQLFGTVKHIECSTERLARFLDKRLCEQVQHRFSIAVAVSR